MLRKKTLLVLSDSLGQGGLQKMAAFVAKSSITHFEKVYLVGLSNEETKQQLDDLITVKKLNYNRTKNHFSNTLQMFKTAHELRLALIDIEPDIVCALGSVPLFIGRIASLNMHIKIIGSERNSPIYYSKVWRLVNRLLFELSDGVVFQTEGAMMCHKKKIREKSVIIPNPYISKGEQLQSYIGEREKTITAAAARFEYKKGFDVLIKAFNSVIRLHPDYKLIIYGKGDLLEDYKLIVKELDLGKSVFFPGITENVANEVHKSSLFVLPSRFEGIPNVLMEVMGAGVPVVASNCHPGGPKLLTDSGRCGLLVPVDDESAMGEAIIRLIQDKELARQLSKEAAERMKQFSEKNIKSMWNNYFSKIIDVNS